MAIFVYIAIFAFPLHIVYQKLPLKTEELQTENRKLPAENWKLKTEN